MEYFIGIILVIITLFIIILILRKRVYDHVDRLELWKMDVMNRNTAAELARVKGLNLTGETQVQFESWKEHWESIVTKELPDVEEFLFEAEDAADRFKFPTANKILKEIEHVLETIENDIEQMINDLHNLLETEEASRKEIENLLPKIASLKSYFMKNEHQFVHAQDRFTNELNLLEKELNTYNDLVEEGNYLEASERVEYVTEELQELEAQVDAYPELLQICTGILPQQLDELANGIDGMIADGYRIKGFGLQREIESYRDRLKDSVQSLGKGFLSEVEIVIKEIEERMKEIYERLEREAIAKNHVESQGPGYQESLNVLKEEFSNTKSEVDLLRKTYYFEDENMEQYLTLDKLISKLDNEFEVFYEDLSNEEKSYTELRDHLKSGLEQLEELSIKHDQFKEQVHSFRKEELEAKEQLFVMQEQLNGLHRKLRKSNIPGVPNFIWDIMENASDENQRIIQLLEKQPLDMGEVQHALLEGKSAVVRAVEQTEIMLEQAYLTEQVIQYANRYRSRYPLLAVKLSEAERLFRSFEYELSLEHAAESIEEIEPGSLKMIENNQEVL